jgi:hypothetical protein
MRQPSSNARHSDANPPAASVSESTWSLSVTVNVTQHLLVAREDPAPAHMTDERQSGSLCVVDLP